MPEVFKLLYAILLKHAGDINSITSSYKRLEEKLDKLIIEPRVGAGAVVVPNGEDSNSLEQPTESGGRDGGVGEGRAGGANASVGDEQQQQELGLNPYDNQVLIKKSISTF